MIELEDVSMVSRLGEVRVPVLHEVSLSVPGGRFVVIVGPNLEAGERVRSSG